MTSFYVQVLKSIFNTYNEINEFIFAVYIIQRESIENTSDTKLIRKWGLVCHSAY